MQIQNQGLAQAQNFIQQQRTMGMVQPFSVSSMFITPAQRVGVMQQQQQAMYNRNLQAAQVAAMPDPTMAAIGSAISSAGGFAGGAFTQRGLMQQMPSSYQPGSYNPQNDPELYAIPPGNIGGPTDPSNWA
jgi:hypothetical protein